MDDLEARVRCLELAANVARASLNNDAVEIVKIATLFYSSIQTPLPAETQVVAADKQRKGRATKVDDPFS